MKRTPDNLRRACVFCGRDFIVDPRVGDRHRYCQRLVCRRESHRESHKRWMMKPGNEDYYRGPWRVEKVRQWRKANPGYRKGRLLAPRLRRAVPPKLAQALISCGLQDMSDNQVALLLGLVGKVTGSRLSDEMASALLQLMFAGYSVLSRQELK